MKVFQILNNFCYSDVTQQFNCLRATEGRFSPETVFVEAPDYVFEGWGFDPTKTDDSRFLKPEAPDGWLYDDATGTFYPEDGVPASKQTPEAKIAALEAENKLLMEQVSAQSAVASISFVTLCEVGTLDMVTASEHAELFAEWAYPIAYTVGQLRCYNGTLYKCVQAHTSQADWAPDTAASLWSVAADPAEEWPAWSQPVGAHDAYAKGDKVSHKGKHWTSSVDSNVWEPGVYGWTEVTE